MTRFAGVVTCAVLLALSVFAQASSAFPIAFGSGPVRLDVVRVFSPGSDSMLGALTLRPRNMSPVDVSLFNIAASPAIALREDAPAFTAPTGAGTARINLAIPALHTAYTGAAGIAQGAPRLVATAPVIVPSPQTGYEAVAVRTAAPAPALEQPGRVHFGRYAPYTPSLQGSSAGVSVPVRVGGVHFQTAFHAMQVCGTADAGAACASSALDTNAQSFSAGTDFDVRTGNSAVNVGLSSSIEHINNAAAGVFPYVPLDPDAQAGLSYFGLTDVVSHGVGAKLAVPVARRVTVGLQYDRAHYQGDYGNTNALLPGFDARKDTYLGNVTYQLPNTSSAITFSARQYRYQDAFAPNFNLTQTRADLNFTVKF